MVPKELQYLWEHWPISFGITGLLFWGLFALRALLAHQYRAYSEPSWGSSAVVAVNYRESEDVVRTSLDSVLSGTRIPDVFVVVFNGKPVGYERQLVLEYQRRFNNIRFLSLEEADKRRAMVAGARWVLNNSPEIEYIVHMDGDTVWETDALEELIKPFADERIDAVASAHEYMNPDESLWTSIQALLAHWGHNIGQKWQSARFCASCLRGRTNAFRAEVLAQEGFLEEFENWSFVGNRRKSGDDGTLTFLTLKYNYERRSKIGGTFVQMTSRVKTLAEPGWEKFWEMRIRCMGNTYTRYLDGAFHRWFWVQDWRFKTELLTSVVIPLLFFTCTLSFTSLVVLGLLAIVNGQPEGLVPVVVLFCWFMVSRFIRAPAWVSSSHVRLWRWPLIVLVFLFPLMIARWWSLVTIFKTQTGWGSRHDKTVAVSFRER